MKLSKILVPVDYSDASTRALRHAVELAAQSEQASIIEVLHVAQRPASYLPLDRWIGADETAPDDVDEAVREAAEEALARFVDETVDETSDTIEQAVVLGVASERIREVATEGEHDLIVMGTRGRAGLEHVMMGSTTERVLRRAPCPVVTVR